MTSMALALALSLALKPDDPTKLVDTSSQVSVPRWRGSGQSHAGGHSCLPFPSWWHSRGQQWWSPFRGDPTSRGGQQGLGMPIGNEIYHSMPVGGRKSQNLGWLFSLNESKVTEAIRTAKALCACTIREAEALCSHTVREVEALLHSTGKHEANICHVGCIKEVSSQPC